MLSALRCPECSRTEGFLLPIRPTDLRSPWACDRCSRELCASDVIEMMNNVEKTIEEPSLDEDDLERLLDVLVRDTLHPNNFLVVKIRERIAAKLRKKLQTCEEAEKKARLIFHFSSIRDVMVAADPPGVVWEEAVGRLQGEYKNDLSCMADSQTLL